MKAWWQVRSKSSAPRLLAAIYMQSSQLRLVVVQSEPYQVLRLEKHPIAAPHSWQQRVIELAASLPANTLLTLVLGTEHYQLIQLDKPAVPAEEMVQALPWLVRELVSIPQEDMLLDYMDVPAQTGQVARINLVVASRSTLQPVCQAIQRAAKRSKVKLCQIQPEEWLARNLIPVQNSAVLLVLHQPGQEVMLQIIKQGMVYFSRRLRGFSRIDSYAMADLTQGILDNLLLEVQRSLDYFEGQLRQAPVKEIYVQLNHPNLAQIVSYFANSGFSQVRALDLLRHLPARPESDLHEYWLTLAGALECIQAQEPRHEAQS